MLHKNMNSFVFGWNELHYDFVSNSCTTDPVKVVPCENSHSSFITSSSVD